ncbi:MAG TPA: hypothetical protein VHY08_09560, partial [Bacillota bacterium]|nr:hypothetical protein [Bacillota bacterium]
MTDLRQDQEIEEFLNKGLSFEERLLQASALIREQSKHAYPYNLLDARLCLLSIYYHLIGHWKSSIPDTPKEHFSERMQLILIFFQGVDLTETAISEGQYLKAAAMLRQDQGILARLQELSSESVQNGRLPSLKNSPPGTNRFLDHFNTTTPFS